MSVTRREYDQDGKPVWGYAFSYRHRRYRKAGFETKREAEFAEQVMRKTVMIDLPMYSVLELKSLDSRTLGFVWTGTVTIASPLRLACMMVSSV